ncbi:hypothetical protein TRAPUB_11940 [Trametes pubescens]|uniref:DASH complex subunit DAD1 n=1 Tax=Trametes pubescens TaxID=154538 RepID=A0A1M2VVF9_TRAPU|nr:hypothetical protein TRAPUB_11940 [Trametes pubescens]
MEEDGTFFDKERDRLSAEISSVSGVKSYGSRDASAETRPQGFEELLSSSNNLNRKLEEVLGMTREYETIAALWQSFHELMRGHQDEGDAAAEAEPHGLPGTGGHVLAASKSGGTDQQQQQGS